MAEKFVNGESKLSIRNKLNSHVDDLDGIVSAIASLNSRVGSVEDDIVALQNGTNDPVSSGDGTATSFAFVPVIDANAYQYQEAGSSGQEWSRSTSIAGYGGSGYAVLNGVSAVDGTSATAYLSIPASNTKQRKVWLRVNGPTGATVAGRSAGTGPLSFGTLTTNAAWHWILMGSLTALYDSQYQIHGRSAGVAVDGIILTDSENTDVPTGKDGFKAA